MSRLDWAYKLIRSCLACVFIYAGLTKLLNPLGLAVLIDSFGLVPEKHHPPVIHHPFARRDTVGYYPGPPVGLNNSYRQS